MEVCWESKEKKKKTLTSTDLGVLTESSIMNKYKIYKKQTKTESQVDRAGRYIRVSMLYDTDMQEEQTSAVSSNLCPVKGTTKGEKQKLGSVLIYETAVINNKTFSVSSFTLIRHVSGLLIPPGPLSRPGPRTSSLVAVLPP